MCVATAAFVAPDVITYFMLVVFAFSIALMLAHPIVLVSALLHTLPALL